MNTKQKGSIGEYTVILNLLSLNFRVLKPVNEDSPYDLLVDTDEGFIKIQVKYQQEIFIPSKRTHTDKNGSHIKPYTKDEVDAYALVSPNCKDVLYIPYELGGITINNSISGKWNYIAEDFRHFPCKSNYEKKIITSSGRIISEADKISIINNYNPEISIRDNANINGISYGMYYKWITK